jgi:hypothetical protein
LNLCTAGSQQFGLPGRRIGTAGDNNALSLKCPKDGKLRKRFHAR